MTKTTICIEREVKEKLDSIKIHKNESYNDVLKRILEGKTNKSFDYDYVVNEIVERISKKFKNGIL